MAMQQLEQHHATWRNKRLVDVLFQEQPPALMDAADDFDIESL